MWFMIICATILSGVSCVGHVLDSVCRVLRERFQWFTFWYKHRDALHTLSTKCYNVISINLYVHLTGSFSNQLKQFEFPEEFVRGDSCPVVFRVTRDKWVVDYAAAWEATFVYDTIIFILTVAKTWERRRGISGERIGLVQLMLRDGRSCSYL